jgi:hypothetical protein
MRLMIEPTEEWIEIEGARVRVWKGTSENGIDCFVFVQGIAVSREADCSEFDLALEEAHLPPRIRQRLESNFCPLCGSLPHSAIPNCPGTLKDHGEQ